MPPFLRTLYMVCKSSGVLGGAPGGENEKGPVTRAEGGMRASTIGSVRCPNIVLF